MKRHYKTILDIFVSKHNLTFNVWVGRATKIKNAEKIIRRNLRSAKPDEVVTLERWRNGKLKQSFTYNRL